MKRLLLFTLCLLSVVLAKAKLQVSKESDGTVVFTLEASGDIANEFTYVSYANYTASAELQPYLNSEKIKVVTTNGIKMSSDDLKRICGMAEEENNFPMLHTLNLENAELQSDNDLVNLKYMDNLKTIVFPRTTTSIPQFCLNHGNCRIENVVIPDNANRSVTIGSQAFGTTLKTIVLGEVLPSGNSTIAEQTFLGCSNLVSVDFGYGWKEIGRQAFMGCTSLKEVTLPEGLEYIRYGAFSDSAIEAIRLPNTLKKIEATAFKCHYLKAITIPASVEEIESQAFQECYALTDVYVLGTNTKAGNQAFPPNDVSSFYFNNPSNITPVTRSMYTRNDGSQKPLVMLHYPIEAREKYINEHSRNLGGSTYSVEAEGGNIWPTIEDGKYTTATGDYAGWNNFALSTPNKEVEIWEDDVRVDDKWYTMCLPFDMTEVQLKSAYGADVEVVEFSGVEVKDLGNNNKTITLKFKNPVTTTKAHHPYMIHPSINAGNTTGVKNTIVGITKQAENQTSLDAEKVVLEADGVKYTFVGNYQMNKELQQYSYYYYSGKDESQYKNGFYKWVANSGGKWTPYTACILLDRDNGANTKPTLSFVENTDNTLTSIEVVPVFDGQETEAERRGVHQVLNLNGQVVLDDSRNIDVLPQGVYIINGKKYIVR